MKLILPAGDYTVNEARLVTKDYYSALSSRDRYVYDYVGGGDHTRGSVGILSLLRCTQLNE